MAQVARDEAEGADGETEEERIAGGAEEDGDEGGDGREGHGERRAHGGDGAWREDGEAQRQEDAAAAEGHGEEVPEEDLASLVGQRDKGGQRDGQQHDEARDGELREMVRMVDRRDLGDVNRLARGVFGELVDLARAQRHAGAVEDVAREHRADAERESGNRADEREHDAAHGDAAEKCGLLGQEVDGQREDWHDLRMRRAHVDADHRTGQSDWQADERCRKGRDRCRARIRGREDGLNVRLRAEHADDDGREVREDVAHVAVQQVEGPFRQGCRDGRIGKERMRGHDAGDGHRDPDDDHLEDAADTGTLHAAEKGIGCDGQDEQDRRGQKRDAEDRGDDVDGRQAACHRAEQDADG